MLNFYVHIDGYEKGGGKFIHSALTFYLKNPSKETHWSFRYLRWHVQMSDRMDGAERVKLHLRLSPSFYIFSHLLLYALMYQHKLRSSFHSCSAPFSLSLFTQHELHTKFLSWSSSPQMTFVQGLCVFYLWLWAFFSQ